MPGEYFRGKELGTAIVCTLETEPDSFADLNRLYSVKINRKLWLMTDGERGHQRVKGLQFPHTREADKVIMEVRPPPVAVGRASEP